MCSSASQLIGSLSVHCMIAGFKNKQSGKASPWWEIFSSPHLLGGGGSPTLWESWHSASPWETYNVWQPCKAQQCPCILVEQKLWAVNKHSSGAKERGFIVLLPSTSPPRPHLPVVLSWRREGDFYFGFSAGGQSSLGCGIRGDLTMQTPPPRYSTLPSSPSGIESSTFHLPWETAESCTVEVAQSLVITQCAEDCKHAISHMMHVQACEWAHVLLQMISHTHPHSDIAQYSLFIFYNLVLWSFGHHFNTEEFL